MINIFATFAHGTSRFRCVVCGEEKARVALLVSGKPYGLCSTRTCIDDPRRDRLLNSALPHGVSLHDPDFSCAWAGVVHAAWDNYKAAPVPNDTPMQFISVRSAPDPTNRRIDLGLGQKVRR